jgi:hypothetical protein
METHSVVFAWWLPVDHANEIQSDSVTFDFGFYAEQCRHNSAARVQCLDTQQAKLTPEDGDSDDGFGKSVAIDGDTALVGAWLDEDPNGDNAGSAYVLTRSGGNWSLQDKLTPDDGDSDDRFGTDVALDGDTAIVGADQDDLGSPRFPGSAYVFTRSGGSWSQQDKLLPADDGGSFGASVDIGGDTAIVGALTDEDPNGFRAGSAYIFTRSGSSWNRVQKLLGDNDPNDNFGSDVALDGDVALIGAFTDEGLAGNVNAGAAYVYTRSSGTWGVEQKLAPSDGAEDPVTDRFGVRVALDGDTALIGSPSDDNPSGNGAGSAYVYTRSGGNWSRQQKLLADDGDGFDAFGAVALQGDTALIGAGGDEDPNGDDAGSAYVFTRTGGRWNQTCKLSAQDDAADSGDSFGSSVSLDGDTALIGADLDEDPNGSRAGSAYVFVP